MSPTRPPDRAAFVPVLLANALPLVGVLRFGWEPGILVLVYGLEVLLSLSLAGATALVAQRPPPAEREGVVSVSDSRLAEKRGRLRVHDALPPIYPRNVPFTLAVALAVATYAVFFGIVAMVLVPDPGRVLARPDVLASVVALVVGQFVETGREYVIGREYERVSPYAVVEAPARRLFVLLVVLGTAGLAVGSTGALALVVGVKLLVEWSSFRAARAGAERNRFVDRFLGWFAGPAEPAGSPPPVRVPATAPDARVRTARTAVLLDGAVASLWRFAFSLPFFGAGWLVVALALAEWTESAAVFWLGVAAGVGLGVAALGTRIGTRYLERGALEYQRREDVLVAYDRLLGEPQWAAPVSGLRNVTVANDALADRLLGTRTFRVTTGVLSSETERRLGPVADPERLVDAFDLPVATTDLDPANRPLAVVAAVLAAGIVLGTVGALVAPGVPTDARLDALVYAPVLSLVPVALWKVARPDG